MNLQQQPRANTDLAGMVRRGMLVVAILEVNISPLTNLIVVIPGMLTVAMNITLARNINVAQITIPLIQRAQQAQVQQVQAQQAHPLQQLNQSARKSGVMNLFMILVSIQQSMEIIWK